MFSGKKFGNETGMRMGQGEATIKSRETPCDLGGTNFWIQWPWISCAGTKAEAAQRGRAEDGGLWADEMATVVCFSTHPR
jgi:hypothetical protein